MIVRSVRRFSPTEAEMQGSIVILLDGQIADLLEELFGEHRDGAIPIKQEALRGGGLLDSRGARDKRTPLFHYEVTDVLCLSHG